MVVPHLVIVFYDFGCAKDEWFLGHVNLMKLLAALRPDIQ